MRGFLLHKSGTASRGQGELNSLSRGLTDYSLHRKMLSHWVIGLLALSGVAYVSGDDCDPETANICYEDLLHYETIAFPLYGEDEAKLEDTCGHINASFDCLHQFLHFCRQETAQCDEQCQDLIKYARHFVMNSGLTELSENLCDPTNALRDTYLENAQCLYKNADFFASCHNDSQKSQHYIASPAAKLEDKCCFFKWHQECFTNSTRENCGDSATFFVSFAAHKLLGHIADKICVGVEVNCTRPPMPPDDDYDTDNDVDDSKTDKDIDNEIDVSTDKTKEQTDKDIHNEIDDSSEATTLKFYATNWILLPFLYIILSKYIL